MKLWTKVRGWLVPAMRDATEAEIIDHLAKGHAQLWVGERSAFVTQVRQGKQRFLHVWLGGGDIAEMFDLIPGIAAWARGMGCAYAEVNGRLGWARALKPFGFSGPPDELRKPL